MKRALFPDESKFWISVSNRRVYVRRPTGERMKPQSFKPTGKHSGGNIQFWECFGHLCWTDSTLTKEMYQETCSTLWSDLCGEGSLLQQENERKATSKLWTTWRQKKTKESWLSWTFSSTVIWLQSHWTLMGVLEDWESQAYCDITSSLEHWRTWVSRFNTTLWSELECMPSLKQKGDKPNAKIWTQPQLMGCTACSTNWASGIMFWN